MVANCLKKLYPGCKGLGYGILVLLATTARAEIYQWTDSQGRVHFSDKRAAQKDASIVGGEQMPVTTDGLTYTFYPEADALLTSNNDQPQGKSSVLSSGYWSGSTVAFETKSVIRFEISALLRELKINSHKRLAHASLELFANTQDKLYGQGTTNRESPGHSTKSGDNAFYLKPTHNNWQESDVTWTSFYNPAHYIPATVRKLPAVSAAGSDGVPDKDYLIDVTELIAGLVLTQQREFTLELTPQRKARMAEVTFHARESSREKSPRLTINLK